MRLEQRIPQAAGTSGGNVRSHKGCVIFDAASGEVLHVHQVVTIEGAEETSDEDIVRRAMYLARDMLERGTPLPGGEARADVQAIELEALHIDPRRLDTTKPHRVHLGTRSLVAIDQSQGGSSGGSNPESRS